MLEDPVTLLCKCCNKEKPQKANRLKNNATIEDLEKIKEVSMFREEDFGFD